MERKTSNRSSKAARARATAAEGAELLDRAADDAAEAREVDATGRLLVGELSADDVAAGITRIAASGALANASRELHREAAEEAAIGVGELTVGTALEDAAQAERSAAAAEAIVGAAEVGAGISAGA